MRHRLRFRYNNRVANSGRGQRPAEGHQMETKIIQFGEGNFLRAYFDWMVEKMNAKAGFGGSRAAMR